MTAEHGFLALEHSTRLADGYRGVFTVAGHELLLICHDGNTHLLENTCPHAGYPLHAGELVDGKLRCPMHGYLFALDTGACLLYTEGPCRGLYRYELVQQDGMSGVRLPLLPLQSGPFQTGKGT